MIAWYQKVLRHYIPSKLQGDPDAIRKATFTIHLLVITVPCVVLYGFFYIYIGNDIGVYSIILAIVLVVGGLNFFRRYGNFQAMAWIYMIGDLLVILGVGHSSGGAYSVSTSFYGLGIIAAFWVGNLRLGIIWTVFLIIWIMVILPFLQSIFGIPENLIPEAYQGFFVTFINAGILSFFAVMTWIYEIGRKELEEKLKQSQLQLVEVEKMASLGQLTAGVAHEINNPINFVNGSADALKADIDDITLLVKKISQLKNSENKIQLIEEIEKLHEEIDGDFLLKEINDLMIGIQEGGDRIHTIVKSLQTFSHEESIDTFNLVNLEDGLDSTLTILNNKIKSLEIQVFKAYNLSTSVSCNGGKINQVFLNIIDNAIQAMGRNGKLDLKTYQEDNFAKISIQDNGKGINPDLLKDIFNPFFTTKEVGEGTGLGLSISYGIIKDHYGNIEVKSEIGKGSTFIISIPISDI